MKITFFEPHTLTTMAKPIAARVLLDVLGSVFCSVLSKQDKLDDTVSSVRDAALAWVRHFFTRRHVRFTRSGDPIIEGGALENTMFGPDLDHTIARHVGDALLALQASAVGVQLDALPNVSGELERQIFTVIWHRLRQSVDRYDGRRIVPIVFAVDLKTMRLGAGPWTDFDGKAVGVDEPPVPPPAFLEMLRGMLDEQQPRVKEAWPPLAQLISAAAAVASPTEKQP